MKDKSFSVKCTDRCSILEIQRMDDQFDGTEIFISHYLPSFYAHQQPIWTTIKNKLKILWWVLTGKEYLFYDVIIRADETKEFIKNIKKLMED